MEKCVGAWTSTTDTSKGTTYSCVANYEGNNVEISEFASVSKAVRC